MVFGFERVIWSARLLLLLGVVGYALHTLVPDPPSVEGLFDDRLYYALLVAAVVMTGLRPLLDTAERGAWCTLALGLALWTGGELFTALTSGDRTAVAIPSVADVCHLGAYALGALGLLLLARERLRVMPAGFFFDGLIAALAAASLGAALLVQLVLDQAAGNLGEIVTRLAYPIADVFLLALVIGVFSVTRWRPGRSWLVIGAALATTAVADSFYVVQSLADSYVKGTLLDALWLAAMVMIAVAAWQRDPAAPEPEQRPLLIVPVLGGTLALGALTLATITPVNDSAIALACAALAAVIVRLALAFAENARLLAHTHREANTDALTQLGNRRRLIADLTDAAARATSENPYALTMFDLDGFKHYNDNYGHPSGDLLLSRLGGKLAASLPETVSCYRIGGDEFCLLTATQPGALSAVLERAISALGERGAGFSITASFGTVFLPEEAQDERDALRIVDERLYTHKQRRDAERQRPHEPLLQALYERAPELKRHVETVAVLSVQVAQALGLDDDEQADIRLAAKLHDIGKLAVPDDILHKAGPLNEREWGFLRQHTHIGERMVVTSPALRSIGAIIHAIHEHYDGSGYPDGTGGEDIPLASRIITACDALDVMTAGTPYEAPRTLTQALIELQRCAGTQFDPSVINAITQIAYRNGFFRGQPLPGSVTRP